MLAPTSPVFSNTYRAASRASCSAPRLSGWPLSVRRHHLKVAQAVNPNNPGGSSSYYPPIPGYQPVEPSAPPLPSTSWSTSPPESAGLTEEQQLAADDIEKLRASAGTTRNLSFIAFWLQFALSIVSAGILVFSVGFVAQQPAGGPGAVISKYLTLAGVIASFISALLAHGFLRLSRKLLEGGAVTRRYLVNTLLTNNTICIIGIAITVIGLQASVGTLVAKSLLTAASGPYQYNQSGATLVSLDVFSLQASTNTLLCHVIGLVFTIIMLRIVSKIPNAPPA